MAKTKTRRGQTGASPTVQVRTDSGKNTPSSSYPEHLPCSMRKAWRQLAKAAEAWIDTDGALITKVSYVGTDGDCHLAGMVDQRTAQLDIAVGILADEGLPIDRPDRKPGSKVQA